MLRLVLEVESTAGKVLLGLVGAEGGRGVTVGRYFKGLVDHVQHESLHPFLVGLDEGGHAA